MKKVKKLSVIIIAILAVVVFSIPVMAANAGILNSGFDFDLGPGEDEFSEAASKSAGTSYADVDVTQFISSYSRDNMSFRVYRTRGTSYPLSETRTVNNTYYFSLAYTSTGASYSEDTYLRGYGSSANYDSVWAYGSWWA